MDPLVLIDAIAICMAYEEKELCKIGEVALAVIFDVASIILGSKERVRFFFSSRYLFSHKPFIENICHLKDFLLKLDLVLFSGVPASIVLLHSGATVRMLL